MHLAFCITLRRICPSKQRWWKEILLKRPFSCYLAHHGYVHWVSICYKSFQSSKIMRRRLHLYIFELLSLQPRLIMFSSDERFQVPWRKLYHRILFCTMSCPSPNFPQRACGCFHHYHTTYNISFRYTTALNSHIKINAKRLSTSFFLIRLRLTT